MRSTLGFSHRGRLNLVCFLLETPATLLSRGRSLIIVLPGFRPLPKVEPFPHISHERSRSRLRRVHSPQTSSIRPRSPSPTMTAIPLMYQFMSTYWHHPSFAPCLHLLILS